jgi:hypothetical protein
VREAPGNAVQRAEVGAIWAWAGTDRTGPATTPEPTSTGDPSMSAGRSTLAHDSTIARTDGASAAMLTVMG